MREKEKIILDYTTPYKPQLNGAIAIIFAVMKEGSLDMLLNVNLIDTYHKMMWAEVLHRRKSVQNSMVTEGSTDSPFQNFDG